MTQHETREPRSGGHGEQLLENQLLLRGQQAPNWGGSPANQGSSPDGLPRDLKTEGTLFSGKEDLSRTIFAHGTTRTKEHATGVSKAISPTLPRPGVPSEGHLHRGQEAGRLSIAHLADLCEGVCWGLQLLACHSRARVMEKQLPSPLLRPPAHCQAAQTAVPCQGAPHSAWGEEPRIPVSSEHRYPAPK